MRFIHSADWHLGRQFHNVSLLEDQAHVLDQVVTLARKYAVDALLIAGDVYDRAVPSADAVALLNSVLEQIVGEAGLPVVMISGNHDSAERLAFGRRMMSADGLHVYGPLASALEPLIIEDEHGPVYFCPIPYAEPSEVRLQLQDEKLNSHNAALSALAGHLQRQVPKGARSVGIAHCWVTGGQASDSERPITVGGAGDVASESLKGFTYAALGHLHRPQAVSNAIHYSGSLLKYSFSEINHRKSVNLVEINAAGQVEVKQIALAPKRDVRMITGEMATLLKGPGKGEANDDYLLVRLTDRKAILDAVGKLREVYPNILHLERPGLMSSGRSTNQRGDHRGRSEFELFQAFHAEISSEPMIDGAEAAFTDVVESIRLADQEASS